MKTKFFFPVIAMIAFSTVANAAKAKFNETIRVDNAEVVAFERRAENDFRVTAFERRTENDFRVTAFNCKKRVEVEFTTPRLTMDVRSQNNVVI